MKIQKKKKQMKAFTFIENLTRKCIWLNVKTGGENGGSGENKD